MKMQKHIFLGQTIGWTLICFAEGVKVHRFSLPLVGEGRLWYESLRPIALEWNGLETQFR